MKKRTIHSLRIRTRRSSYSNVSLHDTFSYCARKYLVLPHYEFTKIMFAATRAFIKPSYFCKRVVNAKTHGNKNLTRMAGSSSYLAPDTYHSMSTADDELIFLHTMLRASNLEKTMSFFEALGLQETRRKDSEKGKYTLAFMATSKDAPEIEITYNWGDEEEVFGTFCIT